MAGDRAHDRFPPSIFGRDGGNHAPARRAYAGAQLC
jgi:hypothetical protein